jgi:chromosome segregation ATPase
MMNRIWKQRDDLVKENQRLEDRIKRLEEASQQLKSLNNKICDINLKVSQERDDLNVRIKRLDEWKESALEVEREWDANAVATMLGAKLGESQRKVIQREVPLLLERIKRLDEAGDAMRIWITVIRGYLPECTNIWRKAKEAKL